MPFVEIADLPSKEIVPGYTARTVHTGTMSFVYWSVQAGAVMPEHDHLHQQVAHVISGRFELTVGNDTRVMHPGMVALIPPHVPHGGKALTDCTLLDALYPEREDYRF